MPGKIDASITSRQRTDSRAPRTDTDGAAGALTTEQFEVELRRHLPSLFRRALRYTRQQEAADDLVQDTLERAYRKLALFRPGTELRAWLLTIMRNVWITGHRRRSAECPSISMEALEEITLYVLSAERAFGESMVERLVVDHLGETAILDAMQALPQAHREVVLLIDVMGAPYKVVAETLRIPLGSVCSRLSRGREQLRQILREQGHTDKEFAQGA